MRAIILVAGRGSRLPKNISQKPKSLIKINSKTLIDRQIQIFRSLNIKDIALVTGYKKHMFNFLNLKKFHNENWKKTNMVHSLTKADNWLKRYDCIVTYGDIIFTDKSFKEIIKSKSNIAVTYDSNWRKLWKKRFKDPLSDAETFIFNKNNILQEIGMKTNKYKKIMGQFMGIIKFKPYGWKQFKNVKFEYFKKENKIYTTDILNSLAVNNKVNIKVIKYNDKWSEIDNFNDIKISKRLFK